MRLAIDMHDAVQSPLLQPWMFSYAPDRGPRQRLFSGWLSRPMLSWLSARTITVLAGNCALHSANYRLRSVHGRHLQGHRCCVETMKRLQTCRRVEWSWWQTARIIQQCTD